MFNGRIPAELTRDFQLKNGKPPLGERFWEKSGSPRHLEPLLNTKREMVILGVAEELVMVERAEPVEKGGKVTKFSQGQEAWKKEQNRFPSRKTPSL